MSWEEYAAAGNPETQVRQIIRAATSLHASFKDEIWLWRGQADGTYGIEPAMHTRVRKAQAVLNEEASVVAATDQLVERAREAGIGTLDGVRLPDLALLAHLQHHGAATPLLDVTVDPLVALWMVAFATRDDHAGKDDRAGYLFGIVRPPQDRWIEPFDSRRYADVAGTATEPVWYRAPDVSERLRIQRGSFLLGRLAYPGQATTVSLGTTTPTGWLTNRIANIGAPGRPLERGTDVVAFKVAGQAKPELRAWLRDRAGLTPSIVYPTPWHRPYLDDFCAAHGRLAPLHL